MKSYVCLLSDIDSYLLESSKQEVADEVLCVLSAVDSYRIIVSMR